MPQNMSYDKQRYHLSSLVFVFRQSARIRLLTNRDMHSDLNALHYKHANQLDRLSLTGLSPIQCTAK